MYLKSIMSDYLKESTNDFKIENNFKPLEVRKSDWILEDKKIKKVYKFDKKKFLEFFVVEIIKYIRDVECDIELRFREFNVGIIIHSYSSKISELELDCSKEIDKIKKDVMYYYADEQ
jgi:hypothetical protein